MKKAILEWLYKQNKEKPFVVQQITGKKASPRIEYPSGKFSINKTVRNYVTNEVMVITEHYTIQKTDMIVRANQRQIMPFELCFDIDSKEIEDVNHIVKFLDMFHIKYSIWRSGGKGHHIHCFFKDMLIYNIKDRHTIREAMLMEWCSPNTDLSRLSEGNMIQLEFANHRNTSIEKSCIYPKITGTTLNPYKDIINENLPEHIVSALFTKKAEVKHIFNVDNTCVSDDNSERICLKYLLTNRIKEGARDNLLFVLLSRLKKYHSATELLTIAKAYSYRNGLGYSDSLLISKINGILNIQSRCGCNYIRKQLNVIGENKMCEVCLWNNGK